MGAGERQCTEVHVVIYCLRFGRGDTLLDKASLLNQRHPGVGIGG